LFLNTKGSTVVDQGFPNWGICTPRGTFAYRKGYIRVAIEGKKMFIYYSFRIIYTYISEYYF